MLLLGGILLTSFIIGSIYMFSPNHGIATTDLKSVSNDVQKFKFKDGTGNLASLVDKNGKKLDLREMDAKWQAKNLEKLAENLAKLPPRPPQNSPPPLPPPPPLPETLLPPPPPSSQTTRKHTKDGKSKLLVGGSDGSGTRSVVSLLQDLGVTMVIDDTGTNDVHGAEMFSGKGWPDVVRPALQEVHTANYNVEDLSPGTVDALSAQITNMNNAHVSRKGKWTRGDGAELIDYGIKAPVSMLLVPMFNHLWERMKFIHVVRDGRDIAFSGNQSPVKKFYTDSFVNGQEEYDKWTGSMEPVRPLQLWNDWNADLYDWERERVKSDPGFDFLVLRTEDLLDVDTKYKVLLEVGDFVGTIKTKTELCCMARKGVKDMGSHTYNARDGKDVKARYGKWQAPLDANKGLSDAMHEQGERGLREFGYEPHDFDFFEKSGVELSWQDDGFECNGDVVC